MQERTSISPRTKVYARVGVQAAGKTELIYSQVYEIGL